MTRRELQKIKKGPPAVDKEKICKLKRRPSSYFLMQHKDGVGFILVGAAKYGLDQVTGNARLYSSSIAASYSLLYATACSTAYVRQLGQPITLTGKQTISSADKKRIVGQSNQRAFSSGVSTACGLTAGLIVLLFATDSLKDSTKEDCLMLTMQLWIVSLIGAVVGHLQAEERGYLLKAASIDSPQPP